jgi:hypothetical protein
MESVYQGPVDQETAETAQAALTPQDQFRLQWRQQTGFIPFIRQKNVIDQNAGLVGHAAAVALPGWTSPLMFALQGLVLVAVILSLANWQITRHAGSLEGQIVALRADVQTEIKRQEEIIAATEAEIRRISNSGKAMFKLHLSATPLTREQALQALSNSLDESHQSEQQYKEKMAAREQELRARQSALALAHSGSPLMFSLALVLAAWLVGRGGQKDFPRARPGRRPGDLYLYFAAAEGLWPNLVLLVFLHLALSHDPYGLSGLLESVGPLFWVVFWAGFYLLLLRYFAAVARGLQQALEIKPASSEWSLENTMLMRIHNSVAIAFAALEAVFLLLCYLLYAAQRHAG